MKNHFNKVFIRVSGVLVALDMPDPRTEWKGMIGDIVGVVLVFGLSMAVIVLLCLLQGAPK